jgi:hypothetical protein
MIHTSVFYCLLFLDRSACCRRRSEVFVVLGPMVLS